VIVLYKRFWAKQARECRRVLEARDERVSSWAHAQSALADQGHWDPIAIRSQVAAALSDMSRVANSLSSSAEKATGKGDARAATLSVWLWAAYAQSDRVFAAAAIDDGTSGLPRETGRWHWVVAQFRDGQWAMAEVVSGERVFDHLNDQALASMGPERLLSERYARGAIEIDELDALLGPALAKPLDTTSLEIFGR
jgi:hypothetical protein